MIPRERRFQLEISDLLSKIRAEKPIVQNITNLVVMNFTANALLALGASPIMAHAEEESEDLSVLMKSLVLNPGTLDSPWVKSMEKALSYASRLKKPVVLDPVGAGASQLRTKTARRLLEFGGVSILRGNASEILALNQNAERVSGGVDNKDLVESTLGVAQLLSKAYQCIVVVSGPTDLIIDHRSHATRRTARVHNGASIMTRVTGLGCSATALIAAAAAASDDPFLAAVAGMAFNGISGEIASGQSRGPGSFIAPYLDALAALDCSILEKFLHMEYELA